MKKKLKKEMKKRKKKGESPLQNGKVEEPVRKRRKLEKMEDPVQTPKEKVDMVDIRKFFGKMREKTECGKDKQMQSDECGLARQQHVDQCGNETECGTAMQS